MEDIIKRLEEIRTLLLEPADVAMVKNNEFIKTPADKKIYDIGIATVRLETVISMLRAKPIKRQRRMNNGKNYQ